MPSMLAWLIAAAFVLGGIVLWRFRAAQARPSRGRTDGSRRPEERIGALDLEPRVADAFRTLLAGPKGGFLVVSDGVYYVQAAWRAGQRELLMEAVSNEFLPAGSHLDAPREQALAELGFTPPGRDLNFSRTFDLGDADPERLARLAATVFAQAFRSPPGGSFEVTLELD